MKLATQFTSLINLNSNIDLFKIDNRLHLTSSSEIKSQTLKENTIKTIGALESQAIFDNKVLAFELIKDNVTNENKKDTLHDFSFRVDNFIIALWVLKDNSVYKELCYLSYNCDSAFFSNFIAQINSNHRGQKLEVSYSETELNKAVFYYKKINILMRNDNQFNFTQLTPDTSRLSRYLYFITGARLIPDVGIKYILFCTSLETLVIPEKGRGKIPKSLAERIDLIIKDQIPHSKTIVHKAYEYRSEVIHGNTFKHGDLKRKSKFLNKIATLDSICRLVLRKILDTPELEDLFQKSDSSINSYFETKIKNN